MHGLVNNKKDLKKAGWEYSKAVDGGTMSEINTICLKLLKSGKLDTRERNSSAWEVAEDDNIANWEMLTFSDDVHGSIKIVSYKVDPFQDRKYGTIFIKFQDKWWYKIRTSRDITTDIVNMFANPNRFASSIDKFEGGFKYFHMDEA